MNIPVDLTNLKEITGGDPDLEKEIFNEFIFSFEVEFGQLRELVASNSNDNESWRISSHTIKGLALNLGAEKLGNYCKESQEKSNSDASTKSTILERIEEEYLKVKEHIKNIHK